MKKILKITVFALTLALLASMLCLFAFAEEITDEIPEDNVPELELPEVDAELVEGATFEVIAANGLRRSSGILDVELEAAAENYFDGDTIVLLSNINIVPRDAEGNEVADTTYREDPNVVYRWATLDIGKIDRETLNFDLNGYGLILRDDDWESGGSGRQNNAIFRIDGNSVVNIYSSEPGGFLFGSSTLVSPSNYYTGGFLMGVTDTPTVHIGKFTKADGTVVSGNNISTSGAGFINFGDGAAKVYVDGGTYYRYRTGSQVGLIAHREGSSSYLEVKNANLICYGMGGSYMIRGVKSETVFDNCLIYNVTSDNATMVSNGGGGVGNREYYRFTGKLTLKDCVTNYDLAAVSIWPENDEGYIGQLFLEGETVFRSDAVTEAVKKSYEQYKNGFNQLDGGPEQIYKGVFEEGTVLARVSRMLEVDGNPILYIPGYGDTGAAPIPEDVDYNDVIDARMALKEMTTNLLFEGYTFVPEENTINCKFIDGSGVAFDYIYKKGVTPEPSLAIMFPNNAEEGIFKYGWKYSYPDENHIRIEVAKFADFDVRVSFDFYAKPSLNIYVQKEVFDTYIDPVDCVINGAPIVFGSEKEVAIDVGGEDVIYYCFEVNDLTPADLMNPISFSMPLNYWSESIGERIQGDGTWEVDIFSYFDRVVALDGCTDAEKQMMNDLLNYVKTYYIANTAEEELDAELLSKLDERINTESLTVNNSALAGAMSPNSDTLDASIFGTVSVDKTLGRITVNLSSSFSGEIRVYAGGCVNIYEVSGGKVGNKSEIVIDIPVCCIFDAVEFKVVAAGEETAKTGSVYLIDQNYSENAVAQAYYAYAYAAKVAYNNK